MANCGLLLNDGSSFLLLNDSSFLLLNDNTCTAEPGAETATFGGGTALTKEELARYIAYWRALAQEEKRKFKSEQARDKAFRETIVKAYRKAKGIPEPIEPGPSPIGPQPPSFAAETIEYLGKLKPRSDSVLEAALSELYYLRLKVNAEREARLVEARLRRLDEDEEDMIIMLLM